MNIRPFLAALVLLPLLSACKPSVKSLRHLSVEEDIILRGNAANAQNDEVRACVAHYLQTGDARYATPEHGITLLHIAAATHRLWLVEQLLAEGADPNARLSQGDTPAMLAVRAVGLQVSTDALLIIKALHAAGADLNLTADDGGSVLSACNGSSYALKDISGEELALAIMDMGAQGNTEAARNFAFQGWSTGLRRLLDSPQREAICRDMPQLLGLCAFHFQGKQGQLDCAALLLEHAEDVNASQPLKATPLFLLLQHPQMFANDDSDELRQRAEFLCMLLDQGANPYLLEGDFQQTCAADLLQQCPELLSQLKELGQDIPPPPHEFAAETLVEQLADIPAAAVDEAEIRAQFDTIAQLFTAPTEAMLAHGLTYRRACATALKLLCRADIARTEALLATLPAWQGAEAWQGEVHAANGLLHALQQTPAVAIPGELLLTCARSLEAAGKPALAHALARLLGRDAAASERIVQLCEAADTPLSIRAAAWRCRAQAAGLPALGEVEAWMRDMPMNPFREISWAHNAETHNGSLIIPAPEGNPARLFFEVEVLGAEEGPRYQQDALLHVGAALAAHLRGEKAPADLDPQVAECQTRYGIVTAASFELEIALARYVLQHAELFRKLEADAAASGEDEEEPFAGYAE